MLLIYLRFNAVFLVYSLNFSLGNSLFNYGFRSQASASFSLPSIRIDKISRDKTVSLI